MCARDWPKYRNEHPEAATRGDTVGEERDGDVSTRQTLSHDAGADDNREQKRRAQRFGGEATRKPHCLPIALMDLSILRRSSFSNGKLVNNSIRPLSRLATRPNSRCFSSAVPSKSEGSSTPQ